MEKITLYTYEMYSLNFSKQINELYDKIQKDKELLDMFNHNPSSKDYLVNKLIFQTNLYTYYKLILENFFGKAITATISKYKDFDNLLNDGWVIFDKTISIRAFDDRSFEEVYMDYLDSSFSYVFPQYISLDNEIANNIYVEIVTLYKNKMFNSCALTAFSLIEFLYKKLSGFSMSKIFKIKESFESAEEKISSVTQPFKTQFDYFSVILKNLNKLIKDDLFKKSVDSDDEPIIICRNRLAHGIYTRHVNRKDCLQLLCIINALKRFNDLVDADLKRIDILEEINEMQVRIKNLE
jgi:hypothetical protein